MGTKASEMVEKALSTCLGHLHRVSHATFCAGRTQWVVVSAAAAKNRMRNRQRGPKRRVPHAPTAIGGIADGVRRSTADTLERG